MAQLDIYRFKETPLRGEGRASPPLLEEELARGHFGKAADLAACVGICEAYSFERVILANIRAQLRHLGRDPSEVLLFAALLLRHVRDPGDVHIFQATRGAWQVVAGEPQ
jgi:hypothetical protein